MSGLLFVPFLPNLAFCGLFCMLDVNLIVFLLSLRAKFRRPALSALQNANLSAEILQILGLNLARKFDAGLPNQHKFNADIQNPKFAL